MADAPAAPRLEGMDRRLLIGAVLLLVIVVGGIFLVIGITTSERGTGSLPAPAPLARTSVE